MIDDYIEEGCVAYRVANSKEAKFKLVDCHSKTTCFPIVNNVFSYRKQRVWT